MTSLERAAVRAQLMQHEGLRLRPYTDTVGKLTIGCGRNLTDKGLTADEAMTLLDHDIDDCLRDLQSFGWVWALDAVRRRAVIDLRFNLGPGRFRTFRKFLVAMELGHYVTAKAELIDSLWYTQVGSRAVRLCRQIETGEA